MSIEETNEEALSDLVSHPNLSYRKRQRPTTLQEKFEDEPEETDLLRRYGEENWDADDPDNAHMADTIMFNNWVFNNKIMPTGFNINPQNGLWIAGGLIGGLAAMYSPISLWPSSLKTIGLVLGLGVAGLGIADALGIFPISNITNMVPKFGGYASNSLPYDYPERY